MPQIDSPWYPYEKVNDFNRMPNLEIIPKQLCDYLLDLPSKGYTSRDDNSLARCRLIKYLYYDGAQPLTETLPTVAQKMSIVYDPTQPDAPPTPKGYRIYPLTYTAQAQLNGQTILRCYIGRVIPTDPYTAQIGIIFEVLSSMSYENNTKSTALSRVIAIEQCLWEALNGVNINGVGAIYADRRQHGDTGSYSITDEDSNVGRRITFALTMRGGGIENDN